MLVARRFVFFDFNLKSRGADFGCAWIALASRTRQLEWRKRSFFFYQISDSLTQIIQDDPEGPPGVEEDGNHTRRLYCLPPGIAACYPRSVNRNIFYIIGVIVVIVIVLKLLHVF